MCVYLCACLYYMGIVTLLHLCLSIQSVWTTCECSQTGGKMTKSDGFDERLSLLL